MKHYKKNLLPALGMIIAFPFLAPNLSCKKTAEKPIENESIAPSLAVAAKVANEEKVSITDFGAVGDGKTNNYKAFLAAAAFANERKKTTIYFPKGNYYISTYRTKENYKSTPDIIFNNVQNLKIYANNDVVISTNSSFKRTLDYVASGNVAYISYTNAITPFVFKNCKNVVLAGFELNGNIQHATRDASVTEGTQTGVSVLSCDNVTINDMYIHHMGEDGVYIDGVTPTTPSTNVYPRNVKSHNNARQGMSICGANNVFINNCEFSKSGFTGKYTYHGPAAGVDIEPGESGRKVSNIHFHYCTFQDNIGGQLLVSHPYSVSNVTLANCTIIADAPEAHLRALALLAKNISIDKSTIRIGERNIYVCDNGSNVRITNSTVEGSGGIYTANSSDRDFLYLSNNIFKFQGTVMKWAYPKLKMKNLQFLNNNVFIPSAAIKSRPEIHCSIENAAMAKGNIFQSENSSIKPKVSLAGSTTKN